ncbi:MAG: hypothetical protein FWD11_04230 [Micrococcales bacterium]|nr:hypothetical protein [Micrococcales bacterium]
MSDPDATCTPVITPLPAEGHRGVDCFSVACIHGATSFPELLGAFRKVEAEYREKGRCFLTLDDLNQCLYTSMHAIDEHVLDEVDDDDDDDEVDRSDDDATRSTAEFHAVSAVLHDPARSTSWDDLAGALATEPGDIDALVTLNRDPGLVLDDVHVVQCLPTDDDADLLANIPNGYFEGDWTPFDCYAVVRRVTQQHGYTFFGIGAATLGFLSTVDPGDRDVPALIADLQKLYGHHDSTAWSDLAAVAESSPVLLLGYIEDFADTTGANS